MTLWVKVDPAAGFFAYDNLLGFTNDTGRLTLQTMPYLCWNGESFNGHSWLDLKSSKDPSLIPGIWSQIAITISEKDVAVYLDGAPFQYSHLGSIQV